MWPEIARVSRPGGAHLSQVGANSVREPYQAMMGQHPDDDNRGSPLVVRQAEDAGLDLREQSPRLEFFDIAAVGYFLREVFRARARSSSDQLADLHERIQADGTFVANSTRFLIEAREPG